MHPGLRAVVQPLSVAMDIVVEAMAAIVRMKVAKTRDRVVTKAEANVFEIGLMKRLGGLIDYLVEQSHGFGGRSEFVFCSER